MDFKENKGGHINMSKFIFLFLISCAYSQPSCDWRANSLWNTFVHDANIYATKHNKGILDLKLRQKLPREWKDIMGCECW